MYSVNSQGERSFISYKKVTKTTLTTTISRAINNIILKIVFPSPAKIAGFR